MKARRVKRLRRLAQRLPRGLQDIAFSKNGRPRLGARRSLGKFGPASEVRKIDPGTGP